MTTNAGHAAHRSSVLRTLVWPLWEGRTWVNMAHLLTGTLLSLITFTVLLCLLSSAATLAVTAVLAVPFLIATYEAAELFTSWQRTRFRRVLRVDLAPTESLPRDGHWLSRAWAQTKDAGMWRQIGYHTLSGITLPLTTLAVLTLWVAGPALALLPAYSTQLPHWIKPTGAATLVGLSSIGIIMLLAAPWGALLAVRLDAGMATALLAPSRSEELARRVASLSESRADMIDATDAERRRIERDLHDGTQQRLVSLAMNLGMTRTMLVDVPPEVRDAIERAHDEAKLALSELRAVIRGMHPAILDDLGLDAALSGIAARSPVPVRLMVDLPRRPSRTVETVAYFVVSEALANVAKHAQASQIDVIVEIEGDLLRIVVRDDGRGGADQSRGTGLRGLRQRIAAVDGALTVDSPVGGPTILLADLPCA
ncbi:histidine kinase [Catellatospora methionotrophica]|uniref:histidine kinase n=1 Tax=Catellatospora methionotrophica TaxID=121620 RepID=A0A8J3PJW4_9ACTN|nr:sensor histidine kinase [Catellatospora methionotrophica]GIG19249.1 histidine kinase [Catellatospora methionotrophica]